MTAKRDNLFPSASIGRAQGANIAHKPSRETLTVHPLLGPVPSASPPSATLDSSSNAKYVPYTPRQRPATTGATVQATATLTQGSGAPVKPQLANLRVATQDIGLDVNSVGWAILEKISCEGDSSDGWSEIWNVLTKGKGTLLLPSELSSGNDMITPEFVQDHIVLCDPTSRENTAVVTLSGLRGQLVNDSLTFRSALHRSTRPFQDLLSPSVSRAASLDALPPLPVYPPESSYPSFTVSAFSAVLPFPSRPTKPPLPPRPAIRGAPTSSSARLSMPFASLFGQRPSTPPPQLPPTTTAITASPSADVDPTIDLSAFVIDTVLSRTDIASGIISALKGEIAVALNDYPPWVVERVHTFALPCFPFVKAPAGKKKLQDIGGNSNRFVYVVNGALDKPEELADKFQAFYTAVEREFRNGGHVRVDQGTWGDGLDTNGSQDLKPVEDGLDASGPQNPKLVGEEEVDDARIRDILETIEWTLCTLLYDRLFLLSTSDDASHNEALSSRVAALNMLDLGLEHLDIDIGDADHADVDAVVRTCGQTLARLDLTARSPREKAAILVSAHKLVVEDLSKIPPIRLKSRDDDDDDDSNKDSMRHPSDQSEATGPASMALTASVTSVHVPLLQDTTEKQSPLVPAPSSDQPQTTKPRASPEPVPPSTSSPVSGDVLLPILIFSVVKANPSRLVSHLLFTQRFRNQSFGGEESYCLINLMAVAEFLENVDLGALGLGESEKGVPSTADLTPIPITRPSLSESPIATSMLPGEEHAASLRGRVGQGVDAIAGSANRVILGVVDTSFGVLRALLPGQTVQGDLSMGQGLSPAPRSEPGSGTGTGTAETDTNLWGVRPSLGLLRRETGFSIAGLTVALPGAPGKVKSQSQLEEEGQRELVEVSSRPPSLKSHRSGYEGEGSDDVEKSSSSEGSASGEEGSEDEEGEGGENGVAEEEEEEDEGEDEEGAHDTRSIKSFEKMLSSGRRRHKTTVSAPSSAPTRRKRLSDLTDRLTYGMAGMSRRVQGGDGHKALTTSGPGQLPPPSRRFLECTEQDIRVSEVGDLLREYQRLVEAVRSAGGFQE